MGNWTPEELEAMRLADEEIEREFTERYVADQVHKEMDVWLDELAIMDLMDHKSYNRRKKQKQYSAAYRAEHREEIAPTRLRTAPNTGRSTTLICASI